MLDIRFIRENPELVRDHAAKKGYTVDIAQLLKLDESRRKIQTEIDILREQRNIHTASMKGAKPSEEQIKTGQQLKEDIAAKEAELSKTSEEFSDLVNQVPNILADDVP